jgi:hypothetical protein
MLEIKTVTNGPIAVQRQSVCHDTLPWFISFSLDGMSFDDDKEPHHSIVTHNGPC